MSWTSWPWALLCQLRLTCKVHPSSPNLWSPSKELNWNLLRSQELEEAAKVRLGKRVRNTSNRTEIPTKWQRMQHFAARSATDGKPVCAPAKPSECAVCPIRVLPPDVCHPCQTQAVHGCCSWPGQGLPELGCLLSSRCPCWLSSYCCAVLIIEGIGSVKIWKQGPGV